MLWLVCFKMLDRQIFVKSLWRRLSGKVIVRKIAELPGPREPGRKQAREEEWPVLAGRGGHWDGRKDSISGGKIREAASLSQVSPQPSAQLFMLVWEITERGAKEGNGRDTCSRLIWPRLWNRWGRGGFLQMCPRQRALLSRQGGVLQWEPLLLQRGSQSALGNGAALIPLGFQDKPICLCSWQPPTLQKCPRRIPPSEPIKTDLDHRQPCLLCSEQSGSRPSPPPGSQAPGPCLGVLIQSVRLVK